MNPKDLYTTIKNSLLYSLSGLLLRAASVFLFPVFTLYLSKEDYGILSVTQSIAAVIAILGAIELPRAVTRFIYLKEFERYGQDKIVGNALWLMMILNLILCLVFLTAGGLLLKPLLGSISFYPFMFFTLLAMPLTSVFDFYRNYLKSIQKGKTVFFLEMLYYGGNVVFNVILVVFFKLGVMGIIYSTLIVGCMFLFFFLITSANLIQLKPNTKILAPMIRYTLPLFIFILLGFILEGTDKIYLNYFMGVDVSGVYYIALTYATIFSAIKEAFNSAFVPWYFSNKEKLHPDEIKRIYFFVFAGAGILCAGMSAFSYEVLYLLSSNPELVRASDYTPVLLMALYVVFIGQFYNIPVLYKLKESGYLIYSNLAALIVLLVLCPVFIPAYNEYGAVLSRWAAFVVMTGIQLYLCKRHTDVPVQIYQIVLLTFVFSALSVIGFLPIAYPLLLITKIILLLLLAIVFAFRLNKHYGILKRKTISVR